MRGLRKGAFAGAVAPDLSGLALGFLGCLSRGKLALGSPPARAVAVFVDLPAASARSGDVAANCVLSGLVLEEDSSVLADAE
jgi:hypothetical protein